MGVDKTSFTICRENEAKGSAFAFVKIGEIREGVEGLKMIAMVESEKGVIGAYFLKPLIDKEEGEWHEKKQKYFKRHGVNVPNIYKTINLEDGSYWSLIEDLTQDNHYLVLSINSKEIGKKKNRDLLSKTPQEKKATMTSCLIRACEAAAGIYDEVEENKGGEIYELQPNAFFLQVNPSDPKDVNIVIGDLGQDVMYRSKEEDGQKNILIQNLLAAASFYTVMTGESFQLPHEHPMAELMNERLKKEGFGMLALKFG